MYNITLRSVRETIVAVENKKYYIFLCVSARARGCVRADPKPCLYFHVTNLIKDVSIFWKDIFCLFIASITLKYHIKTELILTDEIRNSAGTQPRFSCCKQDHNCKQRKYGRSARSVKDVKLDLQCLLTA